MEYYGFLADIDLEEVVGILMVSDLELRFALVQVDLREGHAFRAERQLIEDDIRTRGQTHRAAIFKLDFCPAVVTRNQAIALPDRHVHGGAVVPVAIVEVHLPFDIAEAHDARVGLA
jgi:hypothetical protein